MRFSVMSCLSKIIIIVNTYQVPISCEGLCSKTTTFEPWLKDLNFKRLDCFGLFKETKCTSLKLFFPL